MADNVKDTIKQKTSFSALWSVLDFEKEKIHKFLI
jgi:hypothetical protein